jgi:hypothetical protein
MNDAKYLIVKGIAGLGNRMLSALTGILYAKLSGRRLIVDWSDSTYSSDGSNVFNRLFQCSSVNPNDQIPVTDSVSPLIWRAHLRESAWEMTDRYGNFYHRDNWKKFSIDLTRLDYQEDVVVMWTFVDRVDFLRRHFRGEFKEFDQKSRKEILSKLLREDLNLHPQIRERVDKFKSIFFSGKTVGVHVRYTDHRAGLWTILDRLNKLLKQEPELQIFLATDNIQIKRLFDEKYQRVITSQHWYPAPGLTIHQNPSCPDPLENGIEALTDLYLLAECSYLIVDTSSIFSYVAALLTNAPDSNIFNINSKDLGGKRSPRRLRLIWRLMLGLGLLSWGPGALNMFMKMIEPIEVRRKR